MLDPSPVNKGKKKQQEDMAAIVPRASIPSLFTTTAVINRLGRRVPIRAITRENELFNAWSY